jgi:hypothetical protein
MALESVRKTPATRCALSVGDIIRRHDGKSYIVRKVWFDGKTGHWIADESPLQELQGDQKTSMTTLSETIFSVVPGRKDALTVTSPSQCHRASNS